MKPYKKGFKLFFFLIVLSVGTYYVIRKADILTLNLKEAVKSNLEVDKNYIPVSNSSKRKLNKADKSRLALLNKSVSIKSSALYIVDHRFRLNDTLYTIQAFIDESNKVLALDKPSKINNSY